MVIVTLYDESIHFKILKYLLRTIHFRKGTVKLSLPHTKTTLAPLLIRSLATCTYYYFIFFFSVNGTSKWGQLLQNSTGISVRKALDLQLYLINHIDCIIFAQFTRTIIHCFITVINIPICIPVLLAFQLPSLYA